MAQRGGARPGAGRPKGSPNKATQWRQAQVAATGATPLAVMIEAMRHHLAVARQAEAAGEVKAAGAALRQAADLAAQAAPYVHPRLTAVQHSGEVATPYVARLPEPAKDTDEWRQRHLPPTVQ